MATLPIDREVLQQALGQVERRFKRISPHLPAHDIQSFAMSDFIYAWSKAVFIHQKYGPKKRTLEEISAPYCDPPGKERRHSDLVKQCLARHRAQALKEEEQYFKLRMRKHRESLLELFNMFGVSRDCSAKIVSTILTSNTF